MTVPKSYSELSPKQKSVTGLTTTMCFIILLSLIAGLWIYKLFIVFLYMVGFGVMIRYTPSPYYLSFSVGGSMIPAIPHGLKAHLCKKTTDNIEIHDVVTYEEEPSRTEGYYIHHRVIDKTEEGLVLRGDNNSKRDPEFIESDDVIHKTIQYGYQPVYVPISPFSIIATLLKMYRKIKGEHKELLQSNISN